MQHLFGGFMTTKNPSRSTFTVVVTYGGFCKERM